MSLDLEGVDRRDILLSACLEILKKCKDSPTVLCPTEVTAFYDGTDCDGLCLIKDIENYIEYGC